jgi:hypothetical protein
MIVGVAGEALLNVSKKHLHAEIESRRPGRTKGRQDDLTENEVADREVPISSAPEGDVGVAEPVFEGNSAQDQMPVSVEQARKAKTAVYNAFKKIGDVVGVGITRVDGDYAVKINLATPPDPNVELPKRIEGVPVRVEVTGVIKPL